MSLSAKLSLLALVIFALDILTKCFTHHYLPPMELSSPFYPYGGIGVFKDFLGVEFSIAHRTNTGAAWGFFADYPIALLVLRIFLVGGLAFYLFTLNAGHSWRIPLVLVLVGAVGNILDFFLYGHVVDMFHFILWGYDYPVFNIADTAIFVGVAWLIFLTLFERNSCASAP